MNFQPGSVGASEHTKQSVSPGSRIRKILKFRRTECCILSHVISSCNIIYFNLVHILIIMPASSPHASTCLYWFYWISWAACRTPDISDCVWNWMEPFGVFEPARQLALAANGFDWIYCRHVHMIAHGIWASVWAKHRLPIDHWQIAANRHWISESNGHGGKWCPVTQIKKHAAGVITS